MQSTYAESSPAAAKRLQAMRMHSIKTHTGFTAKRAASHARREEARLARTVRAAARTERRQMVAATHSKQNFKHNRSKLQSKFRRVQRKGRR